LARLRSIVTALLLCAGLTAGLLPATAYAAGPGATLFVNTDPRPIDLPGDSFAGGVSVRLLLEENGVDIAAVTFVTITRADGGLITLRRGDLASSSSRFTDNGTTTRFVRRDGASVSATADTGPLQINVNGGDISVTASVDQSRVDAGATVTFSVRVHFAPPGAQLTYEWDFGDGSVPKRGIAVRHVYDAGSDYQARVTVRGSAGSTSRCATTCVGTDAVDVTVGDPPPQPATTTPSPGSGTGDPNVPGSSNGTGGGGQGGSGGDASGTGTDPSAASKPAPAAKPEPKPEPKPKPEKPFGVTISGVLIDDPGVVVSKLPSGTPAGAPKGPRHSGGGDSPGGIEIPLTGLLAMAFISLGALRERRGVRLRVA
jgi:hypothetical protein